jgi:hypothetical protein
MAKEKGINGRLAPCIDICDARRSWFVYAGQVYSVEMCPSSIFRAAVLIQSPTWIKSHAHSKLLKQHPIDFCSRWWLLLELAYYERAISLYPSRDLAQGAVEKYFKI